MWLNLSNNDIEESGAIHIGKALSEYFFKINFIELYIKKMFMSIVQ